MAVGDYNIFSASLPASEAAVAADSLTPEQRQQLVVAFSRKFRLPENQAHEVLEGVRKSTVTPNNPNGFLPSLKNLEQKDVGWAPGKRSEAIFSQIDNLFANAVGAGPNGGSWLAKKIPGATMITPHQWGMAAASAISSPMNKAVGKGVDAVAGKHKDNFLVGLTKEVGAPLATWSAAMGGVNTATGAITKTLPHGVRGALGTTGKTLGAVGTGVDIADAVINTARDLKDIYTGAKKQRYTDETINAIGRGASPRKAMGYYQLARYRDMLVDHAKVAAIALTLKNGGTRGMVTAFGGSRVHADMLPPVMAYNTIKDELSPYLKSGREGAVARRIRRYRNRDGYWNGLLKSWSGNYFNYENDHVLNQINRERSAFTNAANELTKKYNPNLTDRIARSAGGAHTKYLLGERDKWLRNTKADGKQTYFDKAVKMSGADPTTL